MKVIPSPRRSTTRDTAEGLEISIPATRSAFAIVFLPVWLAGWAFGEVSVIREILSAGAAPRLFLGIWLIAWTVGGGFALCAWAWMVTGREVLLLRADSLSIRRELLGLSRSKEYDVEQVTNLRVSPVSWSSRRNAGQQLWGGGGGPLTFDYGAETVRVGGGIDEAEARQVVSELKSRHAFPESSY